MYVLRQNSSVERRFLFGGISVDLSADSFYGMDDLPRGMVGSSFEDAMLDIVRHAVLFGRFVPCTGSDHHTDICHRRRSPPMHNFDAIWQNMIKSLAVFLHIPFFFSTFAPDFVKSLFK